MSNSLWPHRLQPARPSCPSPSPGDCPSPCSLYRRRRPAISSSDAVFSFCPQSSPAPGTFLMSCLFASDDQNAWASASASVLPGNVQGWSPLRLTGVISLLSKGLSGDFSSTTVRRHQLISWSLWEAKSVNAPVGGRAIPEQRELLPQALESQRPHFQCGVNFSSLFHCLILG